MAWPLNLITIWTCRKFEDSGKTIQFGRSWILPTGCHACHQYTVEFWFKGSTFQVSPHLWCIFLFGPRLSSIQLIHHRSQFRIYHFIWLIWRKPVHPSPLTFLQASFKRLLMIQSTSKTRERQSGPHYIPCTEFLQAVLLLCTIPHHYPRDLN
jgi:hypothetical protein